MPSFHSVTPPWLSETARVPPVIDQLTLHTGACRAGCGVHSLLFIVMYILLRHILAVWQVLEEFLLIACIGCRCTYLLVTLSQRSGLNCLPYPTMRLNVRKQFPGDMELHLEVMQKGW